MFVCSCNHADISACLEHAKRIKMFRIMLIGIIRALFLFALSSGESARYVPVKVTAFIEASLETGIFETASG